MPHVELGNDPALYLERALLIYKAKDSPYDTPATVITSHEVQGGVIQPGAPLDVAAFRKLLDGGSTHEGWSWGWPRMLAENKGWRVWWSPRGRRDVMFLDRRERTKGWSAWVPSLVWAASRTRKVCYLFAYDGASHPTRDTLMYRPGFGPVGRLNHIHNDCMICVGSMQVDGHDPASWEKAFWGSHFKELGTLKRQKPYACKNVFREIGPLGNALSRCHPSD